MRNSHTLNTYQTVLRRKHRIRAGGRLGCRKAESCRCSSDGGRLLGGGGGGYTGECPPLRKLK
jgi:hypothetical protein